MIKEIQDKLRTFTEERDWKKFHTPKNLVMALSVEVAELTELFQWSTDGREAYIERVKVIEEIADVFIYLLMLSDKFDIDIEQAASDKIIKNALKYPVEKCKGRSARSNEL